MTEFLENIQKKYTLYINLNERKDRLSHVENELKKMEIEGERFPAIKTQNGAIGCTLSHIKCIEIAKERNYPYVFICEDDITFLNPTELKEKLNKFGNTDLMEKFDVLIIGGNNCPPYRILTDFCIRISNCQTTTGYIVASRYYDILLKNFKESAAGLLRNQNKKKEYALDMYWKRLQGEGIWFMIYPPSVIQYPNYSNIEERETNYAGLMMDVNKEWLFSGGGGGGAAPGI